MSTRTSFDRLRIHHIHWANNGLTLYHHKQYYLFSILYVAREQKTDGKIELLAVIWLTSTRPGSFC